MNTQVAVHTSGSMMITGNEFTMNSYDFLKDVINPIRVQNGEPEIRNDRFIERIEDELDDILTVRQVQLNDRGNKQVEYYDLTIKQMMLVGMRESKGCRRQVLEYIETLENSMAPKTPALPDFSNPVVAARAWADEYEARQQAQAQLAIAAPKAEVYDQYLDSDGLMGQEGLAKTLGMTAKAFGKWCDEQGGIYHKCRRKRTFIKAFIDAGYGRVIPTHWGPSAKFTHAGVLYIIELHKKSQPLSFLLH